MKNIKYRISNSEDGFTLIEVLVVIIIIGVLGSIAAPGWLSFLNRQRANTVKNEFMSAFREVQEDAKQQSTERTIAFKTTSEGPVIEVGNGTSLIRTQNLGDDVKNIKVSFLGGRMNPIDNTPYGGVGFDYRGGIVADEFPFVVQVGTDGNPIQKCLIVTTLLGGVSEGSEDECDNPVVNP